MRSITSSQRWFAAAVCLIAASGVATAEEAVLRISDSGRSPGVVRLADSAQTVAQPANMQLAAVYYGYGAGPCVPGGYCPANFVPVAYSGPGCAPQQYCPGDCRGVCPPSGCSDQGGCCEEGCSSCSCGDGCCGAGCGCGCSQYGYGKGYDDRMLRVFAKAAPANKCKGGSRYPKRWWRGQQMNYLSRNQRLSNILFGWMVPSGCGGQGCPPVGCYQITYADQPGYQNPHDSMAYGAQGYGVPVTVPLPPNVRHSYNYSSGIPASRISHIGHYSPGSSPQPLYHQSW